MGSVSFFTATRSVVDFNPLMEIVVLHNAKAGKNAPSEAELTGWLRAAGFSPHYLPLREGLAQPGALPPGEFVIIAGGDGSLREAMLALAEIGRPLAPLPLGTANNIARSLGVTGSPTEVVAGWARAKRRRFDLGVVQGPWGKRLFVEGVGVGLISRTISIVQRIDESTTKPFKDPADKLRRDADVLTALAHELSPEQIELDLDGDEAAGGFILLEVLNIDRAGPRARLAPRADPSDGRLDVVLVREADRLRLVDELKKTFSESADAPLLPVRQARRVRLRLSGGELRVDDEVLRCSRDGPAEIVVTVLPGAVNLVLAAGPG